VEDYKNDCFQLLVIHFWQSNSQNFRVKVTSFEALLSVGIRPLEMGIVAQMLKFEAYKRIFGVSKTSV
jgi:hypothetical protein